RVLDLVFGPSTRGGVLLGARAVAHRTRGARNDARLRAALRSVRVLRPRGAGVLFVRVGALAPGIGVSGHFSGAGEHSGSRERAAAGARRLAVSMAPLSRDVRGGA